MESSTYTTLYQMAAIQQTPCGEHGHKCAMYLKQLRETFPFSWAFTLIIDPHSVYIYLAQACLKLTGSDQVLAQQIWDIYVLPYKKPEDKVTPAVFMKTLTHWNEFCSVAFALGENLFESDTTHFLTAKGCNVWIQMLKDKMGLPKWNSLTFHIDTDRDDCEHDIIEWEDFLIDVCKAFTTHTTSSLEQKNSLFLSPQCSKCTEIGH
jgi:hypothetical protein